MTQISNFHVCCVSEAGVLVKSYVERSMLVPDQVITSMMLPRLEQLSGQSWLLDGKRQSQSMFSFSAGESFHGVNSRG